MRTYQRLPMSATQVIIQTEPSQRVTFFMPATRKWIRRYEGRGTTGALVKEEIDIPPMLYIWDPVSRDIKMYVFEIRNGRILCRLARISNVHAHGGICWGGEPPSQRDTPRLAYTSYWESTFNDDLTRYPHDPDSANREEFYSRFDYTADYIPEFYPLDMPELLIDLFEENIEPPPYTSIPWRDALTSQQMIAQHAREKARNHHQRVGEGPDITTPETCFGIGYILARQESLGCVNVRLWRRYQSGRALIRALENKASECDSNASEIRAISTRLTDIIWRNARYIVEQTYPFTTLDAVVQVVWDTMCEDQGEALDFFYGLGIKPSAIMNWVRYATHNEIRTQIQTRRDERETELWDEWRQEYRSTVRADWWAGGWITSEPEDDMTEYIVGTKHQRYESLWGFYCQPRRTRLGHPFRGIKGLGYLDAGIYAIHQTPQRGTMVCMVNNVPLIGTLSKKGQSIKWEVYDEAMQEIQKDLEEIFS